MGLESINDIWEVVCNELKNVITDVGYRLWIADLKPVEIKDKKFILSINVIHKKEIIESQYKEVIETACLNALGLSLTIEIILEDNQWKIAYYTLEM